VCFKVARDRMQACIVTEFAPRLLNRRRHLFRVTG
jgi:hypothetical protein